MTDSMIRLYSKAAFFSALGLLRPGLTLLIEASISLSSPMYWLISHSGGWTTETGRVWFARSSRRLKFERLQMYWHCLIKSFICTDVTGTKPFS